MKTKYDVGEVVYIKAVVESVSMYTDKKGVVVTKYCVKTPEVVERLVDELYLKEGCIYTDACMKGEEER